MISYKILFKKNILLILKSIVSKEKINSIKNFFNSKKNIINSKVKKINHVKFFSNRMKFIFNSNIEKLFHAEFDLLDVNFNFEKVGNFSKKSRNIKCSYSMLVMKSK